MRFAIFYFSGTGNTKWAVDEFARLVVEKGFTAECHAIEKPLPTDTAFLSEVCANADYIGLGYPVYGANLPPIVRRFLVQLKMASRKSSTRRPVFAIATVGFVNAFGPICLAKELNGTPLKLQASVNVRLANNASVPGLKSKPVPSATLEKRKATARLKLGVLLDRLANGRRHVTGIGPYLLPGILIRRLLAAHLASSHRLLSVNPATCNQCMSCVDNCPTDSIQFEDGQFVFRSGCTACMRCYNFCPTHSVLYKGKFADPAEFPRYRGPQSKA